MQYPIWEVPLLGGGMVIAIIATVHVMIAHFAVGAGLFTVITEHRAIKRNRPHLLSFLRYYVRYLILVSFILGALTGVGIWFSISLVSPDATSALIHQYVWGWATEWVFFLVEIIAGYIYFYTWDRMEPRKHLIVGWIYAISAYMSLVIINGILAFMLSPGEWIETRTFWDGFFNPTYWPSLVLRTISSFAIAAIFVTIIANLHKRYTREQRHELIIEGSRWLVPLALMIPVSLWYFANVPEDARHMVQGGAIAMTLFFLFGMAASTLVGLYAYIGLVIRKRYINLETSILLGLIAFLATGSMEFVREGIRKPYIIYDYMYSNGIRLDEVDELNKKGVLEWAPWTLVSMGVEKDNLTSLQRGEAIYKAQCMRCHTFNGVNGVVPLIRNWPESAIDHELENLHEKNFFMPPFIGPEKDRKDLTLYLLNLTQNGSETVSQLPMTYKQALKKEDHS